MKVLLLVDSDKSFVEIAGKRIIDHIFENFERVVLSGGNWFIKYGILGIDIMCAISGDYSPVYKYLKDNIAMRDYAIKIDSIENSAHAVTEAAKAGFFEEDKFVWVIKADFYLPPEQWDQVLYQNILTYPVFFVALRRSQRNSVKVDRRDSCLKSIERKSIIYVEAGIYKISQNIVKYAEGRTDIDDAILDSIKEEKLRWGARLSRRLPTTTVFVYPLHGWIPVEDM